MSFDAGITGSRYAFTASDRPVAGSSPAAPPDRACPPEETLARIRPHFSNLGITRVGVVTGLDTVGVPVGVAVRPNGLSLSLHQGKGLTEAAALTSAAMEAVEVALAERAGDHAEEIAPAALYGGAAPLIDLRRLTRCRARRIDPAVPIAVSRGVDLVSGGDRSVPTALVSINHTNLIPGDPFDRSSDGLASGNTAEEAMLHGLLELVERDAVALSRALPAAHLARRRIAPSRFGSEGVDWLADRIGSAGLILALFDITGEFGLPVVAAMLAPADLERRPDLTAASVCGGYACHPDPARAAIGAITEACQARVTGIAGARDDIGGDWYRRADIGSGPMPGLAALLRANAEADPPPPPDIGGDTAARIAGVVERLAARGFAEAVAVTIPAPPGIHVMRMLAPGLEIGPGANGRHVGARLLAAMLRTAA
ncbi:MAG TPA: YcaO-like family protein [Methylomirabilota bacterium]|nr:YcaO-like family protein [Methylomirabilota bacterium]